MKRFKSPRHVQRFLSIHDQIANAFTRHPDQDTVAKFQSARNQAPASWAEVTGVMMGYLTMDITQTNAPEAISPTTS
jgi:putative transposase